MPKRVSPSVDTEQLEPSHEPLPWPQRVSASRYGMVASAHYRATEAGLEMLEEGGNAIDAAGATAFALGVCEPQASGLGGQTMIVLNDAKSGVVRAFDGSSRAPNRATAEKVSRETRRRGYRAATVPSTPATLTYMLERFGSLPLPRVIEPAVRLAEEGFQVTALLHRLMRRERKYLRAGSAGKLFLRDDRLYPVGSTFKQPALAETMRLLAREGAEGFYHGMPAERIHDDMEAHDGLIRKDDLAQIPYPIERKPLDIRWNAARLYTMPPAGAGRTLAQMIRVYQRLPAERLDLDTPLGAATLAEVIRRAFVDRQDRPFDPHFYPQIEDEHLLDDAYVKLVGKQILKRIPFLEAPGETTHLSAMDREGNMVALTQSIENVFGACEACPELGFLYNNYMNAFEYKDIAHPYYLRPNAHPWASVAPTVGMRGREPWLAIGSPGSERIAPSILQVLIRLRTHTPFAAVDAPRLHCRLNGSVAFEASRMRDDIPAELERHGFQLDVRDPYSFYLGCVALVVKRKEDFIGVADPRRDGSARGPRQAPAGGPAAPTAKATAEAPLEASSETKVPAGRAPE